VTQHCRRSWFVAGGLWLVAILFASDGALSGRAHAQEAEDVEIVHSIAQRTGIEPELLLNPEAHRAREAERVAARRAEALAPLQQTPPQWLQEELDAVQRKQASGHLAPNLPAAFTAFTLPGDRNGETLV